MVTRFRSQKIGALLAYLAFYSQRSHPREALIELLWPECDPAAGRHRLRKALSSLRHQLEPPGMPAGAVILADRASVQLNPTAYVTDVIQFEALLRSAAGPSSGAERAQRLTEAVELYRGELLPGYFENWILPERERLAEAFHQALGQVIAHLEQIGDLPRALDMARRAVAADRLREEAHRDLIRLLAAAGQLEAALRQYRELERLLMVELGSAPEGDLRALGRELERSASPATRRVNETISLRPPVSPPAALSPPAVTLLTGTLTFLLCEIVGRAALQDRAGATDAAVVERYHELLRPLLRGHGGHELRTGGERLYAAFGRASDALAAAVAGQRALAAHPWPAGLDAPPVRMALHTGEVEPGEEPHRSLAFQHAGRLLRAAHGGQILFSEKSAVLLRDDLEAGLQLFDLGLYRLCDILPPDRLFQVGDAKMASREFPPPNAPPGAVSNVPLSFTRFFGREAEIAWLRERLLSPEVRLVTLTGPGGSGKTRLALEAAARLREAFRDAVWCVALVDLADARLSIEKTRDALRLPRAPGAEPLEQVVAALSRQPALLLLDNFEHLVTEGAALVRMLLERVPALTCLVTSRQRLDLAEECEFPVPPLPTPHGPESPERLMRCASVRLFVDRAQAVLPDFQVTPANAAAIAAVCQRLEGIPLAIELAAARARMLTPAQMLARLSQRFELLVSRQRGAVARHRSLRAALDWSYELLAPELQQFFAQLCVFRGGWTLSAAEAVCEEPCALEYLEQLQACSLVLAEESGEEMRFRLLETLREYAAEQLAAEQQAELARRHARFYLTFAEEAEVDPEMKGAEQAEKMERLEREHDNLRTALVWSRTEEKGCEVELRFAGALATFWRLRGHWREGHGRLERALARSGDLPPTAARAKALYEAGRLAWSMQESSGMPPPSEGPGRVTWAAADSSLARCRLEESVTICRQLGNKEVLAHSLAALGLVMMGHEAAFSLCQESVAIFREIGNSSGLAAALYFLGNVVLDQGDAVAARALYEESLAICRETEDRWGFARTLLGLGHVARAQGDYAAASALYEETVMHRRAAGSKWVNYSLICLGEVALRQGDYRRAAALSEESLALSRELGSKGYIARSLHNLGSVALSQGDLGTARCQLEESLVIWQELENKWGIANSLSKLEAVAAAQGDLGAVRSLIAQRLALHQEIDDKNGIAVCLEGIAGLAGAHGQQERAARLFGVGEVLREATGTSLPPGERARYERDVAALRAALGEAGFAAAWAAGRAMPLEQAIALARGETEAPPAR